MPIIFHREAYEAAAGRAPDVAAFETWEQLAKALDKLTPEQRCDAVYADWLLQLHSPAHQALLQIRNLLISQGALAANYLAELAQNADDAAAGDGAEIRIVLDGDWLFVANNGRKVTSMNLLGLSRFFVHAAEQIHELNAETIGRFGIGFKSSYRIASEVLVHSWERNEAFAFRLPICRESEPASHPNHERLNHLRSRLTAVGVADLENAFRDVNSLGYCTPERVSALPADLNDRTTTIRQSRQGTLFCFHLRPDKLAEVQQRITGQAHEVYELCPLFLPRLALVQLGPNTLRMIATRAATADLPGVVEADKVTLTTSAPNQPQSHSRFWRLRGVASGDLWQLALHADSQHQLRLDLEDDEQGVTLKEGSAYAFFPLNGMNQTWPFRLHLHCKLPTKLERDNWNPADAADVEEQLRRSVRGMVSWLEAQMATLAHGEWGFERLAKQKPALAVNEGDWPAKWANVIFGELLKAAEERPLIRSVFGRRVRTSEARRIEVIENKAAREAWSQLAQAKDLGGELPAFVSAETAVFGVVAARPDEIGEPFEGILGSRTVSAVSRRAAILAYLSTSCHSSGSLERTLAGALVERADGKLAKLGDLMAEPCGTELSPEWHSCFARLAEWGRDAIWQSAHVFNGRLPEQFRKLSQPIFNPSWAELPARLDALEVWQMHGEQFWKNLRSPCPPQHLASALAYLRVPSGDGGWLPLSGLWLDDDTPVDCFAGLLTAWPLRDTDKERKRITGSLKEWGLFAEWEKTTKKALSEKLHGELTRRLTEQASGDAFAMVFNKAFEDARRPLDGGWAHIVNEAEKTAVSRFVHERANDENLSGKTVLSASIATTVRAALCLDAGFVLAPPWLTDATHQRICRLGLQEKLDFEFLSQRDSDNEAEELSQTILDGFHRWQRVEPTDLLLQGFEKLFGRVAVNRRRDLFIALSTQRRRRVREFFAVHSSMAVDSSPSERLMAARLGRALKHVEPLPAPLDRVAALGDVAVHFGKLRCERETTNEFVLQTEQVDATVAQDADLKALVDQKLPLFGTSQGLRLKWFSGDDLVAELNDADAGWFGDRLVFGHYARPASEDQYVRLLSLYELSDVVSEDYSKAKRRGASPFDLYTQFREHIVEVLVKKHVKEVGYTKEHVLRELLQNAESAYGSKSERVAAAWFEFRVDVGARPSERVVRVRHAGRTFNERDRDGQPRPDIDRIIKINAPNQNTEPELGRFNRGFKSVFTVAKDGRVSVRSGRFGFEILDLLLLIPAEPKEDKPPQAETEFEFTVSKDDALGILGFRALPVGRTPPELLDPTSFIFLTQLRRVTLRWEDKSWEWQVAWKHLGHGWVQVDVAEKTSSKTEAFWVHSGRLTDNRRFGVAVRLGKDGEPKPLEKEWRTLRLTFETDRDFGLDVLVNGDFEADQGRVNVHGLTTTGADIIEAALNAALERAKSELTERFSKQRWVAWAKVLHLKDSHEVFQAGFHDAQQRFTRWVGRLEEILSARVPCQRGPLALNEAGFPTRLMRRLAKDFGKRWGISADNWIEHEAEEELPHQIRDEQTKARLPRWISEHQRMARILFVIRDDLAQPSFEALKRSLSKPERDELSEAEMILKEMLLPIQPEEEPDENIELPTIEEWSVERLWQWWEPRREKALLYTLEGDAYWQLLGLPDAVGQKERQSLLLSTLREVNSKPGRELWYRLFGLACLMAAGRRTSEVQDFCRGELNGRRFWERTSVPIFGAEADSLFAELVRTTFASANAPGEHAHFWRRVFYDVRKMHLLVWGEYKFPETLLEFVAAGHGDQLVQFMKSGQSDRLDGHKSWAGVFGQSASSPVFFLVRELCRLGVIPKAELAKVEPFAFFVSTPVRRAMARIGWLDWESVRDYEFQSLANLSGKLHDKLMSEPEPGKKLLRDYDIPLLHLGLYGSNG